MFTGIIRHLGKVTQIEQKGTNYTFEIESDITSQLAIDESVAHEGVCLTIISIEGNKYKVDAIAETLEKTNLSEWEVGRLVNLELAMTMSQRLDGHMVQGHVDTTAKVLSVTEKDGSWVYRFQTEEVQQFAMVEKGSICVNGTSLTCFDVNPFERTFSVAIIPYTYENTSIHQLAENSTVNIEFDMIGKYILQNLGKYIKPAE